MERMHIRRECMHAWCEPLRLWEYVEEHEGVGLAAELGAHSPHKLDVIDESLRPGAAFVEKVTRGRVRGR